MNYERLFKKQSLLERDIDKAMNILRRGLPTEKAMRSVSGYWKEGEKEVVIRFARARITNNRKKKIDNRLYFYPEDLRVATNSCVAEYRAKRMGRGVIADLCCGIGIQTIALGRVADRVMGIDKDERKIVFAGKNAERSGVKNILFSVGDAEEAGKLKADAYFCDPSRPISSSKRTLKEITPNIKYMVSLFRDIAIELPPQINRNMLNELPPHELEYISLNRKLNRLTAYFGRLRKSEVSAVTLPKNRVVRGRSRGIRKIYPPENFLLEIDPALSAAGLIHEIGLKDAKPCFFHKTWFFTSSKIRMDDECGGWLRAYRIVGVIKTGEESVRALIENVKDALHDSYKRVILRGDIEEGYYAIKRRIEELLAGEGTAHLFFVRQRMLIIAETLMP